MRHADEPIFSFWRDDDERRPLVLGGFGPGDPDPCPWPFDGQEDVDDDATPLGGDLVTG